MVALACQGNSRFVPSLLEAPRSGGRPYYSIATAEAVRKSLQPADKLYFLLGLDAFLDLPQWKDYRRLFEVTEFIVVSRPGFASREILRIVPPPTRTGKPRHASASIGVTARQYTVHILRGVHLPIASRDIREAVASDRRVTGLVPPLVEEYILKERLYARLVGRGSD
jgi:nicotinate-nucleotide adenylyltransferase